MGRRFFPRNVKSLLHFDYPYPGETGNGLRDEVGLETWSRVGSGIKFVGTEQPVDEIVSAAPKFGYRCPQFAGTGDYLQSTNNSGIWNLNSDKAYEISFFVRFSSTGAGNIFTINDYNGVGIRLSKNADDELQLLSTPFGISATGEIALTSPTWHHLVLRIASGVASVWIDGVQEISEAVTPGVTLNSINAQLGGFVGQLDEFLYRQSASLGAPVVPTEPHQAKLKKEALGGYGDGHYGDYTVNAANVQINDYALVETVNGLNADSVTIASNFNVGVFGAPTVGDEVMVHVSAKKASAEDDLGKYAIRKLLSVAGTVLTFDRSISEEFDLSASFLQNYHVQVVSIPQFRNLNVQASGVIVPHTWDTNVGGGLVAFKCNGTFTLNGKIITQYCGPARTDSLRLAHADMIDRFVLTGNVFIVAKNVVASDSARIGGYGDGSLKGGAGGSGNSGYGQSGQKGTVGSGGNGGNNSAGAGYASGGAGGAPGKPGKGGAAGKAEFSSTTGVSGTTGTFGQPNMILIARNALISASSIATGGGGGGGAGGALTTNYAPGHSTPGGGGAGGGDGGDSKGDAAVASAGGGSGGHAGYHPYAGTSNSNLVPFIGKDGVESNGGEGGKNSNSGGKAGGAGYGGGGGGNAGGVLASPNSSYYGAGGGGSGTGFAYIAVQVWEEVA